MTRILVLLKAFASWFASRVQGQEWVSIGTRTVLFACFAMVGRLQAQQPQQARPNLVVNETRLEASTLGSNTTINLLTISYEELGATGGVRIRVQEHSTPGRAATRGLVVFVRDGEFETYSFVDEGEIERLVNSLDELLKITSNPTGATFGNFEAIYASRGGLLIAATSADGQSVGYWVEAGRKDIVDRAQSLMDRADLVRMETGRAHTAIERTDLIRIRDMVLAAQQKIKSLPE
jgi:hypothetical protein